MSAPASDVALEVRDLSKHFRLYDRASDVLAEVFLGRKRGRDLIALQDVSFRVHAGETLGIVGRNGAGKSTLLKIIAGTLMPTSGTVMTRGRLAAILELGSGFHPDFTGRENIYMGGLVLGLTRAEIDARFADIVAFSELGQFIDQPFRTYSTGMQARLSFSVATSVDPDLMIVDEALSVGDARFQLKCFTRFDEMRRAGKTILLVSHNMATVTTLCDRAILLESGRIIDVGEPRHIDIAYHRLLFGEPNSRRVVDSTHDESGATFANGQVPARSPGAQFGTGSARIIATDLYRADGKPTRLVTSGEPCRISLTYRVNEPVSSLVVGFMIRNPRGLDLFGFDTVTDPASALPLPRVGDIVRVEVDCSMWLAAGEYFITFAIAQRNGIKFDVRYDDLMFRVEGTERLYTTSIVNLDHRVVVTRLAQAVNGDCSLA